ncbi:MAG: hypothetical protein KC656_15620, partial [Myxococcales bacterium]|nr:hypothetical protein [Myxococcales bacterium]
LVLLALTLVCWMIGFRFVARPFAWLPLLVVSCAPIWPDLADWVARRQHRTALQAVVDDMQLIQDQATSYLPPEVLGVGEEHRPRRTDRNVE